MVVVPLQALPITTIPTNISSTTSTGDVAYQLANAVQNMSLQTEEIKKLQDQFKLLQDHQTKTGNLHAVELQRAQNQIEAWKKSTTESSIGYTLCLVKEIIWNNIIEEIDESWPCLEIIFKQKEFMEKAKKTISTINVELGEMPVIANNIIKFLNSKKQICTG